MAKDRPKILVLGGPGLKPEALSKRLGDHFEVVVVGDGAAVEPYAAILVDAGFEGVGNGVGDGVPSLELLDAIGEGVCVVEPSGVVSWSNRCFSEFDESTQNRVSTICRKAARWFVQRAEAAGVRGGRGVSGGDVGSGVGGESGDDDQGWVEGTDEDCRHFEIASHDQSRFYEILTWPMWEGEGDARHLEHVAAVVRDVSESRRIRQKMEAIDLAGGELVRLDADAVRGMNVMERLSLLEKKVVKYSRDLLHFDHFTIRLIDPYSGRLETVMACGLPPEAMDLELYPLVDDNGISGYVAATGKAWLCADTEKDERYLPGLVNARSSLTIPLRLHDKVIGVLDVESKQPHAFAEEDRQFGEIFARYVAIAIQTLDLLVVERSSTNEALSGQVRGELVEPLEDILRETDWLEAQDKQVDAETAIHIAKIKADVDTIQRRVSNVASGPQTLLGVEREAQTSKPDPMLMGRRILVADDEKKVRKIIADVLRRRGCEVVECPSGAEAIIQLNRVAEGKSQPFDIVLSDIKMPDHNGYEVFSTSKRCQPNLPVILMTGFGYDPHHSIVRASQDGLQCVLFKPFQVDRMIEEVKKAIADQDGAETLTE